MEKRKIKKLVLGAGLDDTSRYTKEVVAQMRSEGWVFNDFNPEFKDNLTDKDVYYDAAKIDEVVAENSVEEMRAEHLLEHFSHKLTSDILTRWYKVLKEGGTLYVEVPNVGYHLQLIMDEARSEEAITYLFGAQRNEFDYHYTGFTADTLLRHLILAGFKAENVEIQVTTVLSCYAKK